MTVLIYSLERLPWAGAGLLIGYFLGVYLRRNAVNGVHKNRRSWKVNGTHVFGAILVLLGIGTAVQGIVQSRATDRLTNCVAAYSSSLADAIEVRSRASSEATKASDTLWSTLYGLPQNEEGRAQARRVFQEYLEKRKAANRAQEQNPYPPPPRAVC